MGRYVISVCAFSRSRLVHVFTSISDGYNAKPLRVIMSIARRFCISVLSLVTAIKTEQGPLHEGAT